MAAFVCSQARRDKREVSEKHLTTEQRQEFSKAKSKEVNNYVVNAVLSSLPPGMRPPKEKILRMRWVLE